MTAVRSRSPHQDATNPICEGSWVYPKEWRSENYDCRYFRRLPCPQCGQEFSPTREGRFRKHRRLP